MRSFQYDEDDAALVASHNWKMLPAGYVYRKSGRRNVYLHREILRAKAGEEVDHLDGNPANNRRSNLRLVSHRDNLQNRTALEARNTSGFRGVVYIKTGKRNKRWAAQAKLNGRLKRIGYFLTAIEAAKAASDWRKENMPGAVA